MTNHYENMSGIHELIFTAAEIDKMNEYLPEIVFERGVRLYITGFNKESKAYTMIVQQYEQGLDV